MRVYDLLRDIHFRERRTALQMMVLVRPPAQAEFRDIFVRRIKCERYYIGRCTHGGLWICLYMPEKVQVTRQYAVVVI